MTTDEKCRAILKAIVEKTREEDAEFRLGWDWDEWMLTVTFPDGGHTHVGVPEPEGTFEVLIDQLYDAVIHNRGLSKVKS
jgi:hypothetical protein